MARLNRKLVISGATVVALAGVTAAAAFVSNYTTSGSQTITPGAAAVADVQLKVTNEDAITTLFQTGAATFNVEGVSASNATITGGDLVPDVLLPVGCPAAGFKIVSPVLTDGTLVATTPKAVGTFGLTFDSSLPANQNSCLTGPFVFSFGAGAGGLLEGNAGAFVRTTFICKVTKDGVVANAPGAGSFKSGDYIVRVRNESSAPLDYALTIAGAPVEGIVGNVTPGESEFKALKASAAGVKATTTPAANTSGGTASTNETQPCS